MKVGLTYGSIWRVSYPVILAGVGQAVLEATDVAFLAHYGVVEAGAVAIADSIYELLLVGALGLIDGIQVVLARRAGRGSTAGVGAVFRQGCRLLLLASLAVFLLVKVAVPPCLGLAVSSAPVREAADAFLQVVVFGVLFEVGHHLLAVLYIGLGRTRVLIASSAILAGTNVFLDYALIFGHFGFPEMGIVGSAWGTAIAECAAFLFLAGYAVARGDLRAFRLMPGKGWDAPLTRRLLAISTPAALEGLVETGRWLLLFTIVERLGEVALGVSSVVYSCYCLLIIPLEGIAEAVCSGVSGMIGEGHASRIGTLLRRSISLGYALVAVPALLAMVAPELVLAAFTDDPDLVAGAVAPLRVVSLALLLVAPGEMLLGALVGTGDTRGAFRIQAIHAAAVLAFVYAAGILLRQGEAVIWLFVPLGWILRVALSGARLRGEAWRSVEV